MGLTASSEKSDASQEERCYASADALPRLAPSPNWPVVDEGGASDVPKLGLLSTKMNDVLSLGPIELGDASCMTVALGYFASSLRTQGREQGMLKIRCDGACRCVKIKGSLAPIISPFPFVDTDLRTAPEYQYRHGGQGEGSINMSVTALTFFHVNRSAASADKCNLRLTHLRGRGATSNRSRVRVDSLFVKRGCK